VSPKDDCLPSWKLRHLSIRKSCFKLNDAVAAVAAVVPSVVLGEDSGSSDEE
jgi:hypothetical protein